MSVNIDDLVTNLAHVGLDPSVMRRLADAARSAGDAHVSMVEIAHDSLVSGLHATPRWRWVKRWRLRREIERSARTLEIARRDYALGGL